LKPQARKPPACLPPGLTPTTSLERILLDAFVQCTPPGDTPCSPPPSDPFGPAAAAIAPRRDPLVLDLDGNGFDTIGIQNGPYFDMAGDGFAEHTGWVGPGNGFLAMDKNGDGIINDGKELFGDQTVLKDGSKAPNGFRALAEWDDNGDGRIDAADAVFSELQVWTDEDGDGYSLPEELHTLEDLGIKSIGLGSTVTNVADPQGNTQTRLGSFEKDDGSTGEIGEYNFQRDTTYAIPNDWVDEAEDIAELPNLWGYGNVDDLHKAVAKDATGRLKYLVQQFVDAVDLAAFEGSRAAVFAVAARPRGP
ncbi:MAG: hypothetical protein V2B18_15900, partial [Pseudomonadota bacterium]